MRRVAFAVVSTFLFAASGQAADIAKARPAPVAVPMVFSWTGFYAGGNVGGARASGSVFDFAVPDPITAGQPDLPFPSDASSFAAGGHVGYNWQFARNWVAGIEADISWTSISGSFAYAPVPALGVPFAGSRETLSRDVDWFGTIRGRLGYAADRWLVYATGGFAYASVKHNALATFPGFATFSFSDNGGKTGWVLGGGFEAAVTNNWVIGGEYLYIEVEGATGISMGVPVQPTGSRYVWDNTTIQVARFRASYKFGP